MITISKVMSSNVTFCPLLKDIYHQRGQKKRENIHNREAEIRELKKEQTQINRL